MSSSKSKRPPQYVAKVKKLQRAGLLGKVDFRKHATPAVKRALEKHRSFLIGKETAIQASSIGEARALRRKYNLKGRDKTILIPREKGERFNVTKQGEITSVRPNPANPKQRIKKTIGRRDIKNRTGNEKFYYTLPERQRGLGRIKRHTFASNDELLFYLNAYEINFDDIVDYIEIEELLPTSRKAKALDKKIAAERHAAYLRRKRRGKKRKAKKRRKPNIGR
jgi:hypothetical protein